MDEDLAIITQNAKREKIKNFILENRKKIYFFLGFILLVTFLTFFYLYHLKKQKVEIANKFIEASVNYELKNKAYY